jgi:hypothetical protein
MPRLLRSSRIASVCRAYRRGANVWDNAERKASSRRSRPHTAPKTYRTRDEAKAAVFDFVERFYNTKRRHSTNRLHEPHGVRAAGSIMDDTQLGRQIAIATSRIPVWRTGRSPQPHRASLPRSARRQNQQSISVGSECHERCGRARS